MLSPDLKAKLAAAKAKQVNSPRAPDHRILALDVATHCGWASPNGSGVWDFSIKRDESSGMRLVRFQAKLREIIRLEDISLVIFERTAGRNVNALITQSELHGVLKVFCEGQSIPYRAYSASEIKKYATGKGNSNKAAMVLAAQQKYGYAGTDDNEADALHIYHLAVSDLNA